MKSIIIGIDPGLTGAVAVFTNGVFTTVYYLPVMENGKGKATVKKKIDQVELAWILAKHDPYCTHVFLEEVSSMPGQGVASMFSIGRTIGAIEGVLAGLNIPYTLVSPKAWKRFHGITKPPHKKDAKLQDLALARKLCPEVPLARMKDHNRADAILIAAYGSQVT